MSDRGYKAIIEESSKELTAREKLKFTDTTNMVKITDLLKADPEYVLEPKAWAVLNIENAKAQQDKEYKNYIIEDVNGVLYYTGSESFWNSFSDIYDIMKDEKEKWEIKIYKVPSKNREGQNFINVSIV